MSVGFFLTRFKHRTDQELQTIIDGEDFAVDAKKAAQIILDEREASGVVVAPVEKVKSPPPLPKISLTAPPEKKNVHPFDPRPFVKSYGKKDLLSLLSLSMTMLVFARINDYYRSEDQITGTINTITTSMVFLLCLVNNIFFKKDHQTSNTFLGRCFNDVLLMSSFIIMTTLYEFIENGVLSASLISSFTDLTMVIISLIIISLLFEAIVSLFQFLFSFLKWRLV
ncbi:MAG: hypothetical protein Roseis2KO_34340 [Roseivirga sp.]